MTLYWFAWWIDMYPLFIPPKLLAPNCNRPLTSAQNLLRNADVSKLYDGVENALRSWPPKTCKREFICRHTAGYVVVKGVITNHHQILRYKGVLSDNIYLTITPFSPARHGFHRD